MSDDSIPQSSIILYQTEDGRTRVECRFENETIWLSQALIAALFEISVPTVNEHLKGIYDDGELEAGPTIRKFRIVRTEGSREVSREIEHYSLPAILGVGYRKLIDALPRAVDQDFEQAIKKLPKPGRKKPKGDAP